LNTRVCTGVPSACSVLESESLMGGTGAFMRLWVSVPPPPREGGQPPRGAAGRDVCAGARTMGRTQLHVGPKPAEGDVWGIDRRRATHSTEGVSASAGTPGVAGECGGGGGRGGGAGLIRASRDRFSRHEEATCLSPGASGRRPGREGSGRSVPALFSSCSNTRMTDITRSPGLGAHLLLDPDIRPGFESIRPTLGDDTRGRPGRKRSPPLSRPANPGNRAKEERRKAEEVHRRAEPTNIAARGGEGSRRGNDLTASRRKARTSAEAAERRHKKPSTRGWCWIPGMTTRR